MKSEGRKGSGFVAVRKRMGLELRRSGDSEEYFLCPKP
jgi:hypothetical protein